MHPIQTHRDSVTRRHFCGRAGSMLGTAAVASLLAKEGLASSATQPGRTHFVPTAKRVIYLFQSGGPSHLDLLDYKPELKPRLFT